VRFSGAHYAAVFESQSSPGPLRLETSKHSRDCNEQFPSIVVP
jgi:hypothetical protein